MRDDLDDFERAFKRSALRRRIILTVVIGTVAIGPFAYFAYESHQQTLREEARERENEEYRAKEEAYRNRPLIDSEAAELKQLAATLPTTLTERRDRWARDVQRDALAATQFDDASCNATFDLDYELIKPGQPLPAIDITKDLADVAAIARQVSAGQLKRPDLERLQQIAHPKPRVLIVAAMWNDPFVTGGVVSVEYSPAHLVGAAYVYSDGVLCGGELDIANPSSLSIHYQYMEGNVLDREMKAREAAERELESDMAQRISRALKTQLHTVLAVAEPVR